jgi:iron only hydrogenase large subunit-like protein
VLEVDGRAVLRFAAAYGFRNIQGLMRRIKSGKCPYDFVEVMACPSGERRPGSG